MSAYSADKESQIGGQKIKNAGLPSVADKDSQTGGQNMQDGDLPCEADKDCQTGGQEGEHKQELLR